MTAADPTNPIRPFPFFGAALRLTGLVVLAAGLNAGFLAIFGPAAHQPLNLAGGVICGLTGLLALIPVALLTRRSLQGAAFGFLAGMLVRIVLCTVAAFLLQRLFPEHRQAALFWMAGWYLTVLIIEVKLVSSHLLAVAPSGAAGVANSSPASPVPPSSAT